MTEARTHGQLTTIDDRPALVFTLEVPYPIDDVWQAVSEPAKLEQFFPAAVGWTPVQSERFDLGGTELVVAEVEAPHRLAWISAGQPQSFDLVDHGGRTELTFTHVIDDLPSAQTATGWEIYLSRLVPFMAGQPLPEKAAHEPWGTIHEYYAQLFDVDPEPGRRWAAQNLPL